MLIQTRLLFVICLTVKLPNISGVTDGHFLELMYESISINFNRNTFTEFYECLCSDVINTCQTTTSPFHYFPTIPSTQGNPYIANVDATENTTKADRNTSLSISCSIEVTKSWFYIHYYVNITCARTMSPTGSVSTLYSPSSGTCDKQTLEVVWDANVTAVFPTGQTTPADSIRETTTHTSAAVSETTDTTKHTTSISTAIIETTDTTKHTTSISTAISETDTTKHTTSIATAISETTDTTKYTTSISTAISETDATKQTTSISTAISETTDTTKQTTFISNAISETTDTTKQTKSNSNAISETTDSTKQTTSISNATSETTDTTKHTTSISNAIMKQPTLLNRQHPFQMQLVKQQTLINRRHPFQLMSVIQL
ncbi:unnamed protein product [Lymnaea stagnalis]|uniref:Uncharacterized protein n=1 Tax=Lymnaea stagnalis TaxID=6523 RepID=A0AAV2H8K7_LYMST